VTPDVFNALFEGVGGAMLWLNVRALYRAKRFAGVSVAPTSFFAAWGLWNLFYYPHLGQWWSFWGGVNICVANLVWLAQMVYYSRREVGA
jgi:hypothetical protein